MAGIVRRRLLSRVPCCRVQIRQLRPAQERTIGQHLLLRATQYARWVMHHAVRDPTGSERRFFYFEIRKLALARSFTNSGLAIFLLRWK